MCIRDRLYSVSNMTWNQYVILCVQQQVKTYCKKIVANAQILQIEYIHLCAGGAFQLVFPSIQIETQRK